MKINENNLKKKDSVNSKMSELLLAGWTLTNDNCPLCIGVKIQIFITNIFCILFIY